MRNLNESPMRASAIALRRYQRQPYQEAVAEQEALVDAVLAGRLRAPILILTEHPHVYTIGTSGSESEVVVREVAGVQVPVVRTGRGGRVTYHGPGQLVAYLIRDLRRARDLKAHVRALEEWVIRALARFGIPAERDARGIGVWVQKKKVASIGVRCRRWVAYHGVAINYACDLRFFAGIVPCGLSERPITSLDRLGIPIAREALEQALIVEAERLFG